METLEEILKKEKETRREEGMFGITACKESILSQMKLDKKSLFQLLEEYYNRAKVDVFFNQAMILACWELINEKEGV